MRKKRLLIIVLCVAIAFITLLTVSLQRSRISPDQRDVLDVRGYPDQFVITYLPRGTDENPQLVRNEEWIYASEGQTIKFLEGNLYTIDQYELETQVIPTVLKPEDFEFYSSVNDVRAILGEEDFEPVDYLPGFYDESVQTYASRKGVFVFEQGNLTYMQTFSIRTDSNDNQGEDFPVDTTMKTYRSNDYGFTVNYPSDWYFPDGSMVVSNYDTNYLMNGQALPENRIKCDFFPYVEAGTEITDDQVVYEEGIIIRKGKASESSDESGLGYGDNVLFILSQEGYDPMGFLCYAYDDTLELTLMEMLKTFRFLD